MTNKEIREIISQEVNRPTRRKFQRSPVDYRVTMDDSLRIFQGAVHKDALNHISRYFRERETQKRYREKNRDKLRAYDKQRYHTDPEYRKRKQQRDKLRQSKQAQHMREVRARDPEKFRKQGRERQWRSSEFNKLLRWFFSTQACKACVHKLSEQRKLIPGYSDRSQSWRLCRWNGNEWLPVGIVSKKALS